MAATDSAKFRKVLGNYPTGVCAITAINEDRPAAMIVGSFTSVSLDPPLVAFFPDRKSTSWPKILAAGRFCVNVLGAHQLNLCQILASKDENKCAALPYRLSGEGSPVLEDIVAWIDCELHSVHEAGDHFIAMGLVKELEIDQPHKPLLFFRGGYGEFAPLSLDCPQQS